jgi:hypothetical protein
VLDALEKLATWVLTTVQFSDRLLESLAGDL